MLDLHTHSTASDGTVSPQKLVLLAKKIQLSAIAICDHDTTSGIDGAMETATQTGQQLVPGVELSAVWNGASVHLVGLYIDHRHRPLQEVLQHTRNMRNERNPRIVDALQGLGIDITMDELLQSASSDVVGRPHIGALLVQKGVVTSVHEAFDKYLGVNGRAHVPKKLLSADTAIDIIRSAGGVPILAHPHQIGLDTNPLTRFVGELKENGLLGIEVFCSGYTSSMSSAFTQIARQFQLVRSGGSDFHGAAKPDIRLGRGMGSLYVPDELLAPIAELARPARE